MNNPVGTVQDFKMSLKRDLNLLTWLIDHYMMAPIKKGGADKQKRQDLMSNLKRSISETGGEKDEREECCHLNCICGAHEK
jgi:hypothetical protein